MFEDQPDESAEAYKKEERVRGIPRLSKFGALWLTSGGGIKA